MNKNIELDEVMDEMEQLIKSGWRSCIDHIIRPDSPCPVCEIERLQGIIDSVSDFDNADDEAFWEAPHPIFQLSQERDDLMKRFDRLIDQLKERVADWDDRAHEPGPDDYGDACQDCAQDLREIIERERGNV